MQGALQVEELLSYMPSVAKCERALRELNFAWRLIESTAKMVCPAEAKTILPTMQATRDGFNKLEEQLIAHLVQESVAKSVQEIHFKAQVIIDIVVRNLFERTADVGFLASDNAIRDFILDEQRDAGRLIPRLKEYRNKYTVYDEILVLDTKGKVLAHLDADSAVTQSADPLIEETLQCDTYVETFRKSDLRPAQEHSLIYSRKITHPRTGHAIGVLCLCFPLAVEMEGVFAGLRKETERSIMLMLDRDGHVIASSDADHIAPGRRVPTAFNGDYEIVTYAGREYFAKTCRAQNYQGYSGPGWLGHVMIPCETAFRNQDGNTLSAYDAATLAGVMSHAKSFCPPLHEVTLRAESINVALRRVVWNGQIMSTGQRGDLLRLKSILQEISQTGDETSRVFQGSIQDLYATVISSSLQDLQFISRLMIDIMDRNLYERANDCRWWALEPEIRRRMANKARSGEDGQRIAAILESINTLYTAYSRLVVFDTTGTIVAASDLHRDGIETVGHAMDEALVRSTLSLRDSQAYCVSAFEPTRLYGGRPTYIYCAAISHPEDPRRVVGGIGLVFDAETEFRNMLLSSLPKRSGAFAAFVDKDGNVLSGTTDAFPGGGSLRPGGRMPARKSGISAAEIVVHDGQYMMVGHTSSFGYREFKNSDGYHNDVMAMVFVPIGVQMMGLGEAADPRRLRIDSHPGQGAAMREFATFLLDESCYALPAASVIEAVEAGSMNRASTLKRPVVGMLNYQDEDSGSSAFVPVVDMRQLLHPTSKQSGALNEIIVVRSGSHTLGLLVGDLHDVPEFNEDQIEPAINLFSGNPAYVCNLVKTGSQDRMIQVIDFDRIIRLVFDEQKSME